MRAERSKLGESAFGTETRPVVTVKYEAFSEAGKFLRAVLREDGAVGLLHGPEMSGKSTIVRDLGAALSRTAAVATINADKLNPLEFLTEILSQFGYDTGLQSTEELMRMIGVFAAQQTRSVGAPLLIVENIDRAFPSTRITLNALAGMSAQRHSVLRILLTSRSTSNTGIQSRQVRAHALGPLSLNETMHYVYSRLQAVGIKHPDAVIPMNVCDRLHEESAGWPGLLNKAARNELTPVVPRLVLTRDGETLVDHVFKERKVLIGRSEFADIIVPDPFASKLHAVLLLYSDALVLVDLNSVNGTTVNSRQVKSTILRDNDIVSLGHHRLKVLDPPPVSKEVSAILDRQDTVKMRNLVEARRMRDANKLATARRR